ncbi:MAG: hypothetical protein WCT03_25615 [Candidatus Obscuribacterales bacterium]|jgi:hypothetical protein
MSNVKNRHPIPPEIRRACLILGLRAEDVTTETVMHTWERKLLLDSEIEDGDDDSAWFMNAAKDALVIWLEATS